MSKTAALAYMTKGSLVPAEQYSSAALLHQPRMEYLDVAEGHTAGA
jgi:hypothetical protein